MEGGRMLISSSELNDGNGAEESATKDHCEVRFFQLNTDACKCDLQKLLGYVRTQCEQSEEQVLGSVMFTCGGRGAHFFDGEDCADAKCFQKTFPSVPLVGFWAGGEIGPKALAEATPSEVTRVGNAAFQGFTAVFGIFRVPKPTQKVLLATLDAEHLIVELGASFRQLAKEAKERGNAAFRESDVENAVLHYNRAVNLAAVPCASVAFRERATMFANRAAARLKMKGGLEAALTDASLALDLDHSNAKAHYRKAQALIELKRNEEAVEVLRSAVDLLPEEKALAQLLSKVTRTHH